VTLFLLGPPLLLTGCRPGLVFNWSATALRMQFSDREDQRMFTAANNHKLRAEICRLYTREYPGDRDTGCPADRPAPATIVTERDVPLIGPWPR
jgi:hypothetical protein